MKRKRKKDGKTYMTLPPLLCLVLLEAGRGRASGREREGKERGGREAGREDSFSMTPARHCKGDSSGSGRHRIIVDINRLNSYQLASQLLQRFKR